MQPMRPYLIGIAGPSCSGKSCLATLLADRLHGALLSLDSYYRPLDHLSLPQRAAYNFDVPGALDWGLLLSHVAELQQGSSIQIPVYDFANHTRSARTIPLTPAPFVIVEGLFALYAEALRASLGTKIYVELDEELCLHRRIARDVRERGRSRESVVAQYRTTVAPMASRYVYPARAYADLTISGNAAGLGTPGESEFSRQMEAIVQHARRATHNAGQPTRLP
jgi:uridine kinase